MLFHESLPLRPYLTAFYSIEFYQILSVKTSSLFLARNSMTSSFKGIEGAAPFLVTAIAEAAAAVFKASLGSALAARFAIR